MNIITTVGTSLFTNILEKSYGVRNIKSFDSNYKRLRRKKFSDWEDNEDEIEEIEEAFEKVLEEEEQKVSAELDCIEKIRKQLLKEGEKCTVSLIATDTILSPLAAYFIKKWYEKFYSDTVSVNYENNITASAGIVEYLSVTADGSDFSDKGFPALVHKFEKLKEEHKHNVLNITGGYKALIPLVTLYAQINEIDLYYTYEDSDVLIDLPKMPIQFDWKMAEVFYPFLNDPRLLKNPDPKNKRAIEKLIFDLKSKYRLLKGGNNLKRTVIGEIYKQYIEANMTSAKSVFGFIMEYKLYEYFSNHSYEDQFIYVERSFKDKNFCKRPEDHTKGIEIDLVLDYEDPDIGKFIPVEIKSYLAIVSNKSFESLKTQVKRQISGFKLCNNKPYKYMLVLYMENVIGNNFNIMNRHQHKLKELEQIIKNEYAQLKFEVKLCFVEHSVYKNENNPNHYKNFVSNPLETRNIHSFNF